MLNTTAITECTTNSSEVFSPKINNWAEGVLLAIDASNSELTLRGAKRPYASEYAKMLKSIFEKTKTLTRADRESLASAIRLEWKGALETAHAQKTEEDADMTFHLPGNDAKLVIVDERPFYSRQPRFMMQEKQTDNLTDKECKDVDALKDLRIGQTIVVGYDGGLLKNHAYVVIKGNELL